MIKIILTIALFILISCNKNSVNEFKQYHADAPNITASHIPDFRAFQGDPTYTSRNNGYFEVLVPYYSLSQTHREAIGIFKYNGKFINWYQIK